MFGSPFIGYLLVNPAERSKKYLGANKKFNFEQKHEIIQLYVLAEII